MRATLNGYVVADDDVWIYEFFGYSVFSPATVRQAIQDNPDGEELVLELNSPGGSVFAGFEMYSVLRRAQCPTVAEVQSLAASAASTVAVGCDRVLMSPVGQMMIHLPSLCTEGDQGAHQSSIRMLDSVTESILNGYERRCRGRRTREELAQMMAATTWLTAREAVDAGLADGILGEEDPIPSHVVNAVGGGIRAMAAGGLPDPEALLARYRAMQRPDETKHEPAGRGPEHHRDDWRARAALDIEKLRF